MDLHNLGLLLLLVFYLTIIRSQNNGGKSVQNRNWSNWQGRNCLVRRSIDEKVDEKVWKSRVTV